MGFLRVKEFTIDKVECDFNSWNLTQSSVFLLLDQLFHVLSASITDPFYQRITLTISTTTDEVHYKVPLKLIGSISATTLLLSVSLLGWFFLPQLHYKENPGRNLHFELRKKLLRAFILGWGCNIDKIKKTIRRENTTRWKMKVRLWSVIYWISSWVDT